MDHPALLGHPFGPSLPADPEQATKLFRQALRASQAGQDPMQAVIAHTREQLRAAGRSEAFLRAWEKAL